MNKVIKNLVNQFMGFYKNLPPVKRGAMVLSSVILVVAFVVISMMMSETTHSVLFKNVAPDQLPLVLDKLRQRNVPYQIKEDNGTTVLVPSDLLHATQMALMAELGNAKIGNIGLEIFDKQDFGTTSFAQKVNYQRALQGELMRAINTLSAVKQSKVILAIPPKKTFLEETAPPTASIVLELHAGKTLTQDQVRGITHLVASSVENLEPEKVTVVDSRGKVLSKNTSAESAASGEIMELQQRVEQQFEERIQEMLSKVVGSGRVIAKVNVSLNPQYTNTVEEIVDPDATALRSQTSEEELLDGARTNPTGVPGARANLPGADEQGQVGFRQNVSKSLSAQNYEVPKTVKNIREAAGALKKVSVAVLVDGAFQKKTAADGSSSEEWVPRNPADIVKYENIVKGAIGFNAQRGDSVSIENMQFEKESFEESTQLLTQLERKKLLHSLFKWSLLGFALALFFFVVVRPFMRWITDSFQESIEDMLPRTIEELEELQSVDNTLPGMSGALPVLEESLDPNKAESELLKERIMNIMGDDEEKAAGAFSLWMVRKDG